MKYLVFDSSGTCGENKKLDSIIIDSFKGRDDEFHNLYGMINSGDESDVCQIYLKTPYLRLKFSPKFNSSSFSLHPYIDKVKEFVKVIQMVEKKVKEYCKENYPKYKFKSCLTLKKDEEKRFKSYWNKNSSIKNWKNEKIDVKDISNNTMIRLILKVGKFWFYDKKVGVYFSIASCKVYPSDDELEFDDYLNNDDISIPKNTIQIIQCPCANNFNQNNIPPLQNNIPPPPPPPNNIPPPPPPPNNAPRNNTTPSTTQQQTAKSAFIPSTKDLENVRKKLRKVSDSVTETETE